jgi:hypothetical protein
VVSESSLPSANEIARIEEAIEKFMLLAKEAKGTIDENSDANWTMTR